MSQRFGRSKKRALREALAERDRLLEHNGTLSRTISRNNQEIYTLSDSLRRNDVLAQILRDARGLIADRTAAAIVEAETLFLREALGQLKAQGGSGIKLEAVGEPGHEFVRFTVRVPPIYREFGVQLPRERRRA